MIQYLMKVKFERLFSRLSVFIKKERKKEKTNEKYNVYGRETKSVTSIICVHVTGKFDSSY